MDVPSTFFHYRMVLKLRFKVTPNLVGCRPEEKKKNRTRTVFKETLKNYISLEKIGNVEFDGFIFCFATTFLCAKSLK